MHLPTHKPPERVNPPDWFQMAKWTHNCFLQTCSSHGLPCPRKWHHRRLNCPSRRLEGILDLPLTLTRRQHYRPNIPWIQLLTSASPPQPCSGYSTISQLDHLIQAPPCFPASVLSTFWFLPHTKATVTFLKRKSDHFILTLKTHQWLSIAHPVNVLV